MHGFSTAPSVSMIPPAVVVSASSVFRRIRSPSGVSFGISSAVAPAPGNVPMRSRSLIMTYDEPPISMSVQPMPNLL